jgi:hypothetical protein
MSPDTGPGPYEEARSALTWPFIAWFLAAPVAFLVVCVALSATVQPNAVPAAGNGLAVVAILMLTSLVYRCWPTGIRVDASGITIGAVRASGRRLERRKPTVYHQAWGVYSCPWNSVHNARVVTDRAELRRIAKSPAYFTLTNRYGSRAAMAHCDIGVLSAPFMRAALVAEIYPSGVTGTQVRPGKAYGTGNQAYFSRQIPPRMSDTWIVPTRRPEALQDALKRHSSGAL